MNDFYLWIDDSRDPKWDSELPWIWVTTIEAFQDIVIRNRVTHISLDFDLARPYTDEHYTGVDVAKWLVRHVFPCLKQVNIHSSLAEGQRRIASVLRGCDKLVEMTPTLFLKRQES